MTEFRFTLSDILENLEDCYTAALLYLEQRHHTPRLPLQRL